MLWRLFVVALLAPALAFRASPHAANRLAHRAPALSMVIDLSEVAGADDGLSPNPGRHNYPSPTASDDESGSPDRYGASGVDSGDWDDSHSPSAYK